MKLDIVHYWKDEMYRQGLSNEQRDALPVHPAGELELSNADLESVNGGGFGFGPSASGASADSFAHSSRFHSLAFRCNEALFSLTFVQGVNTLSPVNAFCINDQD